MKVWQVGCGVMVLGVVLSLGSCGLFGLAVQQQVQQRQIETMDLTPNGSPHQVSFEVTEKGRIRLELEASLRPSSADLAEADSAATIASAELPVRFRLLSDDGSILGRGAGTMTGSEIIPEAARRDRSSMGEEIDVHYRSEPIEVPTPSHLTAEIELADQDDDGRDVLRARLRVFDRLGSGSGGLAAGGLLSMLAGPFVLGLGLILLVIGILVSKRKKSDG